MGFVKLVILAGEGSEVSLLTLKIELFTSERACETVDDDKFAMREGSFSRRVGAGRKED